MIKYILKEKFLKIILYISAFIPMYILLFVKFILEIINKNLTLNTLNSIMIISLLLLTIVSCLSVFLVLKKSNLKQQKLKILTLNNTTDQHFLSYFSLFVLFALTFELEKISMAIIFVLIIVMIGFVYIKNNLNYINPFFNILGYSFYDVVAIDDLGNKTQLKIFFKGKLETNKTYNAKIVTTNFIILDNKKNAK